MYIPKNKEEWEDRENAKILIGVLIAVAFGCVAAFAFHVYDNPAPFSTHKEQSSQAGTVVVQQQSIADETVSNAELLEKIDAMQAEIDDLRSQIEESKQGIGAETPKIK